MVGRLQPSRIKARRSDPKAEEGMRILETALEIARVVTEEVERAAGLRRVVVPGVTRP